MARKTETLKKKVEECEGTISVHATILDKTKFEEKRIQIRPFVTNPATVGVKFGTTFQCQDGSYAKVDVFISAPCYVEEMVDVFKQTRKIAQDLMENEVKILLNDDESEESSSTDDLEELL